MKPGLRFLSVVSDFLSQDGVLKTFDRLRYGFGALASLATGYEQYQISPMKTDTFRNIDAGVAGAVDFAFGVTLPIIALLDGILNFALPKIAPDIKVKSGGFISGNLASLVRGGVALLEGVCTGDYGAAKTFASKARSGECGVLFEGGVKMFDALAKMVRTQPNESWLTHPA